MSSKFQIVEIDGEVEDQVLILGSGTYLSKSSQGFHFFFEPRNPPGIYVDLPESVRGMCSQNVTFESHIGSGTEGVPCEAKSTSAGLLYFSNKSVLTESEMLLVYKFSLHCLNLSITSIAD